MVFEHPTDFTVSFNTIFQQVPTFALLLSGFDFNVADGFRASYSIGYYVDKTYASYSVMAYADTDILNLKFRWVATLGEHLQLFPISYTFVAVISIYLSIYLYSAQTSLRMDGCPLQAPARRVPLWLRS